MKKIPRILFVVLLHACWSEAAQLKARQNPIRKVIKMLQLMNKKVVEEGEKQEQLFGKFMCYCKETGAELKESIIAAKTRAPQLESSLKEDTALHQQLTEDVEAHKRDRKDAEETMDTAIALRKKEEDKQSADSAETEANIKALGSAIVAVDKGMGDFLQTQSAGLLRKLTETADMKAVDRDRLTAFLTEGTASEDEDSYSPKGGEILGILKELRSGMEKELETAAQQEESSKSNFESLVSAKRKEIAASTKAIEEKMGRTGELSLEKTSVARDIENNQEGQEEDESVLADLQKSCEDKNKDWAGYQKVMAQEKLALEETIKLLNDDEALDLFKKTIPTAQASAAASFLQVSNVANPSSDTGKQEALDVLRKESHSSKDHRLGFLVLALRGKKVGLDQVNGMIDALVAVLQDEQVADDNKKDNCESELDRLADQIKNFKRTITDIDTTTAETTDSLEDTVAQIEALVTGITELDKQVATATENRKAEHTELVKVLTENNAAMSLLELAQNRLNKFYNPKLHTAVTRKRAATEQDVIAEKFGVPATAALAQEPPKKLEQGPDLNYKKRREMGGGAAGMINLLKQDLAMQNTQIETSDKIAQEDYEEFLKNSAKKRAGDSKAITNKEKARAEYQSTLHSLKVDKQLQLENHASTEKEAYILHKDCDFLLQKYDLRKEARADETDSLQKAKAVLAGADLE